MSGKGCLIGLAIGSVIALVIHPFLFLILVALVLGTIALVAGATFFIAADYYGTFWLLVAIGLAIWFIKKESRKQ